VLFLALFLVGLGLVGVAAWRRRSGPFGQAEKAAVRGAKTTGALRAAASLEPRGAHADVQVTAAPLKRKKKI